MSTRKVTVRVGFKHGMPLLPPNLGVFKVRNVPITRFEEGVEVAEQFRRLLMLVGAPARLAVVWEIAE